MRRYRRLCVYTLVGVHLLILAGGIVRSTGSGMGCPDWPKCYDQWIPPLSDKHLPSDYKARYLAERQKKNKRLAGMLEALGWDALAQPLYAEAASHESEDFHATKAWIEYINRLIGVLVGFGVVAMVAWSVPLFRQGHAKVFGYSVASLAVILVQGWLGSIVVSTHLLPFMVSLHLFLAFVTTGCLLFAYLHSPSVAPVQPLRGLGKIRGWLLVCMGLFGLQVLLGSQVRESVDTYLALASVPRAQVLDAIGLLFDVHRSSAVLLLGAQGVLCVLAYRRKHAGVYRLTLLGGGLCVAEMLLGASMYYFSFPAFPQALHLLLSFLLFSSYVVLFHALFLRHSLLQQDINK